MRAGRAWSALVLAVAVAACSGPIAANSPVVRPTPPPAPTASPSRADPQPIVFPADDGPHHRLTEWWYYTGHLATADGHRYGFEFVVFRAERGPLPVTWASHVALTDETGGQFHYAQRIEIGRQVDRSPHSAEGSPTGFALAMTVAGTLAGVAPAGTTAPPWSMTGTGGHDHLTVGLAPSEARSAGLNSLAFDLDLTARKPPVLHDGDGFVDFGLAGGSYYYSRTSLAVKGTLSVNGKPAAVTGQAWFDHQWGDFIAVGAGGWDWFAVNLADGTDLTLSLVRAADGSYPLVYGTLEPPEGPARHLSGTDFTVTASKHWTSPHTGAVYPAGWTVSIPGEGLRIELTPTVADQELDTRASSGVVYWEGSQVVAATRNGHALGGEAYVELTGYPPAR